MADAVEGRGADTALPKLIAPPSEYTKVPFSTAVECQQVDIAAGGAVVDVQADAGVVDFRSHCVLAGKSIRIEDGIARPRWASILHNPSRQDVSAAIQPISRRHFPCSL